MKHNYEQIINYSIFSGLDDNEVKSLTNLITIKDISSGSIIIKEGDNGDSIILLLDGEASITKALTLNTQNTINDTREKEMIKLSADKHPLFGEISFFNEVENRTATITALSNCKIAEISNYDILKLCDSNHEIGYKIMKNLGGMLALSLSKTNRQVLKLTTAFSLVLDR